MKQEQLEIIYESKKDKFARILKFIKKNKTIKDRVNVIENAKALINNDNAKEIIRVIFIDCINAAGGSNLTRNGKASKYFHSKIESLSSEGQIDLSDFFDCFNSKISNFTSLYEYLHESKDLVNFGKKKAALFIYKLDWLQNNLSDNKKIFKNYNIDKTDLIIPLDVVILIMLNYIFGLKNNYRLDQYRDFDLVNSFFKTKIGNKFILIEDLWFWGFFTTNGSGKDREIEFNEDKFYTSEFLKPTKENKALIMDFLKILNELNDTKH